MNAEAAHHTGNNAQAVQRLSEIRDRASGSTYPMGFDPSAPTEYVGSDLDPLDNSIIPASGQELLDFIYLERRREFGMEQLRLWDLIRTGRYVENMDNNYGLGADILEHSVTSDPGQVNPVPVFPIPSF